ncbi:DUF1570 domain-containing protein [Lysobacter silvisoli]|uniref:DUF1570 domain-containing protein n=2 Tax=Lysobacter silvisoli TaxID=2293254 RepID=A0A371K5S3_9GAMM|nr:DUF1570 domain-containing protein [Lysobacter silvisoli]
MRAGSRFGWGLGAVVAVAAGMYSWPRPSSQPPAPSALTLEQAHPRGQRYESEHYLAASSASPERTRATLQAVEALHRAYLTVFPEVAAAPAGGGKRQLVLFGSRAEFRANNRSSAWAEAYYLRPNCYAYADDGANPYHWMLHEATHQLTREVAGLKPARWLDEGLASYFSTSRYADGRLQVGTVDANTYPIWWLGDLVLSGDLQSDIKNKRIVGLRQLIASDRKDLNRRFNQYYIGYWSLTHFLFHHQNGRYAQGYRALLREGGSLAGFERLIGPVEQVEREWYDYLRRGIVRQEPVREVLVVDP